MKNFNKNIIKKWNISSKMNISYSLIKCLDIFSSNDPNLFGNITEVKNPRRMIIVDAVVYKLYGEKIDAYFRKNKIITHILSIKISEKYKNTTTLFKILRGFDKFKLYRRREPIIAIGGGVLLDVVGFAASLYRRGVPYIRVPTTLIGLIDAGIGLKTGINFDSHKNRIGSYYQPLISYIDPAFTATLNTRHVSNGLAEILKMGLIKDHSLFELLKNNGRELLLEKMQNFQFSDIVFDKAIEGMLGELKHNFWEYNLERVVDFGHTFSGALEMKSNNLLHGEAVNIDMALTLVIARNRKLISSRELLIIFKVMKTLKLPTFNEHCLPEILYEALLDSIYHRDGQQRIPIPRGISNAVFVNDITFDELKKACNDLKKLSKNSTIKI